MIAKTILSGAVAAGLALAALPAEAAPATRTLACAGADGLFTVAARYVERAKKVGVRRQFKAEFEVDHAVAGFGVGRGVVFEVADVVVGRRALKRQADGSLAAEIQFDGERGTLPAKFPAVAKGTTVEAVVGGKTVLACTLG